MLHCAEIGQKRIFITADFKLEAAKMFLRNLCSQDQKFK